MTSRWREHSRRVIQEIIKREGREDQDRLKKAISEAYPFGERKRHPYKIWLDEVKNQLGEQHEQTNLF